MQASLCGGFSVLCCPSRSNSGRASGEARYSTLEMGSRRLLDGGQMDDVGGLGRNDSQAPGALIRR